MSDPQIVRLSLTEAHVPVGAFMARRVGGVAEPTDFADLPPEIDLHAAGYAEGLQVAEARHADERAAWQRLLASAQALLPEPSEELAAMIATTVERLVEEIIADVAIDRERLFARINHALSFVGEADDARTVWLHPADAELIGDGVIPLEIHSDPQMERGALRIDCSTGWIEDSHSIHLDALRATLGTGAAS